MFMNLTLAGYLEVTGVVQQTLADEVSPSIMRHTTLNEDPESRNDTSAIQYAKYIYEKMRDIDAHMQQVVCNERTVTRVV
jgi:hypothetical protein